MEDRHPLSVRFHELLGEAGELHDLKQLDYGLDADPFANVRATKDWGMPSWVGAMVRATDKVKRLQTYARKGELANESVIDAFMDLAVYALIGRVLFEQEAHSGSPRAMPGASTYAPGGKFDVGTAVRYTERHPYLGGRTGVICKHYTGNGGFDYVVTLDDGGNAVALANELEAR